mmetsp:Transcript_158888/g.509554  ORF Transcript_158888/g.509554 Transcript_158888/m.509554 type:complete len:225 (+) Transcript_158888:12780-13454(+)
MAHAARGGVPLVRRPPQCQVLHSHVLPDAPLAPSGYGSAGQHRRPLHRGTFGKICHPLLGITVQLAGGMVPRKHRARLHGCKHALVLGYMESARQRRLETPLTPDRQSLQPDTLSVCVAFGARELGEKHGGCHAQHLRRLGCASSSSRDALGHRGIVTCFGNPGDARRREQHGCENVEEAAGVQILGRDSPGWWRITIEHRCGKAPLALEVLVADYWLVRAARG